MELVPLELPDIDILLEDFIVSKFLPKFDALELSPAPYKSGVLHLADDEVSLLVLHDGMHECESHISLLRKKYFH